MKLPKAYLDFLTISEEYDTQDYLGDYTEEAKDLLKENGLTLPDNAYVFYMYQGYIINFFLLTEGDDPPVYYYCEGEKEFLQINSCFTEAIPGLIEHSFINRHM